MALRVNPELPPKEISSWIDTDEFKDIITSDGANNKGRLKNRIDYVKNHLLGTDI